MVVATQGRAFWILDNVSALHQIGAPGQGAASDIVLYKPRDGYRTTVGALGPMVDYYLPAAPAAGRFGRGNPNVARVTKVAGMNRFIWDVRNQAGLSVPPGAYQVRLKA